MNQDWRFDPPGLHLALVDFDGLYEQRSDRVLLVNDFDVRDEQQKVELDERLYTVYEDDQLDNTAVCDCGLTRGEYHANTRCRNCGTLVLPPSERPIESVLWMKVPQGVHGFVSPQAWSILNAVFQCSYVRMIRWLADPNYVVRTRNQKAQALMEYFRHKGWKRSLNYLIENFDWAVEVLLHSVNFKNKQRRELVRRFIAENKHLFFPQYLPVPNRMLFIVEHTPMYTYVDEAMSPALEAIWTLAPVETGVSKPTQKKREDHTVKTIQQLSTYYSSFFYNNMTTKPGLYRKQVFGSRLDFSSRAVISSISKAHQHDEIHIPWGVGVMMLKLHLTNKLLARGYTPSETEAFLLRNAQRYNAYLDDLFKELIAEAPDKGLPVIFQRNPSLLRGSAQRLFITRVKDDVNDNTISLSVLILEGFNADKVA